MPPFTLLFFLFPLLELTLLILAGMAFGGLAVILWILFTAVIGVSALQRAGWSRWRQTGLGQRVGGGSPVAQLADGVMLSTGGLLLFLPGLITDALGLLLLLPATRRRAAALFGRLAAASGFRSSGQNGQSGQNPGVTLDGEYWRDEGTKRGPDDRRLP